MLYVILLGGEHTRKKWHCYLYEHGKDDPAQAWLILVKYSKCFCSRQRSIELYFNERDVKMYLPDKLLADRHAGYMKMRKFGELYAAV